MTYTTTDPRSQLAPTGPSVPSGEPMPMQYFDFETMAPTSTTVAGSRSWVVRAQNVVFVLTDLAAGETWSRDDVDEVMLVPMTDGLEVEVEVGADRVSTRGQSVIVVPPGTSTVTARTPGRLVALHATSAADLLESSVNASLYREAPGSIAVTDPWPEPTGGERLRVYPDVASVPQSPERMGRIYRNRHAMVNLLYPRVGPRDPASLSPHHHDDFEQLSYADTGTFVHHVRAPWGTDRRLWREDEHHRIGSPSLAIIAPPLVHTTEAIGDGSNQLIDVFAGPRVDFSSRPGWVLNAEDYPMPVTS